VDLRGRKSGAGSGPANVPIRGIAMLYILTEYFFCVLAALVLTALWFLCMLSVSLARKGLAHLSQALRRAPRPASPDAIPELSLRSTSLELLLAKEGAYRKPPIVQPF